MYMRIDIKDLQKNFGETKALKGISFSVNQGEAFGLLGRNGAGKTTAIRIILGIIDKDGGSITVDGKDIRSQKLKFGYLPEERGLYLKYSVSDQLIYLARINGMDKNTAKKNLLNLLEEFQIPSYYNKKVESLSKGNKQKIQLIASILHNPDIVVLDEPFSGLDPVNIELFKSVIKRLLKEGKTVLFSSHRMGDVEEFCKRIALLKSGEIILSGDLEDIKEKYQQNQIEIDTSGDLSKYIESNDLEIVEKQERKHIIRYRSNEQVNKFFKEIVTCGIEIFKFEYRKPTLNEIFIKELGD